MKDIEIFTVKDLQNKNIKPPISDPLFNVAVISKTEKPNHLMYMAMHQDYSAEQILRVPEKLNENTCGNVLVKRLLEGGRGHYGCYSADTEVLTSKGWRLWPDVTLKDQLLAVDPVSHNSEFEFPVKLQEYDFIETDKMYYVKGKNLNFLVTQDHRMLVESRRSIIMPETNKRVNYWSDNRFETAKDVYRKAVRYTLNTYLSESQRKLPDDIPNGIDLCSLFKLIGFFFGDGTISSKEKVNYLNFHLRRERKIKYLFDLNIDVVQKKGNNYHFPNKIISNWIHSNFVETSENSHFRHGKRKIIPDWVLMLPKVYVEAFWDGLKNSDGTHIKKTSWCFDSSEEKPLDVLQAMAHINGFSAHKYIHSENEGVGKERCRPCWRLFISNKKYQRMEVCQKGRDDQTIEKLVDYKGKVYCATVSTGALLVRRNNGTPFISGNCIEHPQITFSVGYFPHAAMQQARTHRISVSFDCQSFRYTSKSLLKACVEPIDIDAVEKAYYIRPVGKYRDRQGDAYEYTEKLRNQHLVEAHEAAIRYKRDHIDNGLSEEHARSHTNFDYRQHWDVTFNPRSLFHFLDLRAKADAAPEIRTICELMALHTEKWIPELWAWYEVNRFRKAKLSP